MSVHEIKKLKYNMKKVVLQEVYIALNHSHKKRKDSLEGSLGQVLFAAELEFPKILGSSIICRWTWVPENTSTQATSEFIKCKHWMYRNISLFYYSDVNLLLIDYACCKLCNIYGCPSSRTTPGDHYTEASRWGKNIVAVITQKRW